MTDGGDRATPFGLLKRRIGDLSRFLHATDGSLKRKTVRSGFWVGASSVGVSLLSFIRVVILARLLAPEIFGLMVICLAVLRGVQIFTETGFSAALIHRRDSVDELKDTAFTLTAIRGFLLAIVVALIAPGVAGFYEQSSLEGLLKVIAVALIFNGLCNINSVLHQKELNFRPLFYIEQVKAVLDFAVSVGLAYWWRDIWALVVAQVIVAFTGLILSYLFLPGRPRFRLNLRVAKELFGYGKFVSGLAIIVFITTEIDNVVIGKVMGMEALGFYVVAYTLANLPATHLAKVTSKITFPAYSKVQHDLPRLRAAYLKTAQLVAALAIPAAAGLAMLAPEVVKVLYGQRWMDAATVLPVLCVFGVIRALATLNGYALYAIGRPDIPFYMNLAKLAVIGVAIVPATQAYGLMGAALAVTVPVVIQYGAGVYVFTRVVGVGAGELSSAIWPALRGSLFMAAVLWAAHYWMGEASVLTLLAYIGLGVVVYTAISYFHLKRVVSGIFG